LYIEIGFVLCWVKEEKTGGYTLGRGIIWKFVHLGKKMAE